MKFAIFGLSGSVEIKPLPGAWIGKLVGVVLGAQDHKEIKFTLRVYSSSAAKGLNSVKSESKVLIVPVKIMTNIT